MAKSLEYAPSNNSNNDVHVVDEPRLIVWAGTSKYELCSGEVLTDPELDWLAQKLSDWLELPIVKE
jgi:hypothetical protein